MDGLVGGSWPQTTGLYASFVGWELVIFSICLRQAKLEGIGEARRVANSDA
jgi:hypothetical protein